MTSKKQFKFVPCIPVAMIAVLCLLASFTIQAAERHIHVNGEHLDPHEIPLLDQLAGGFVPNGFYWLDFQSGAWGYEGSSQVQGYINQVSGVEDASQGNAGAGGRPYFNSSQNGSVVSGRVNGQNCTYVTAGGMTMKSCD